VLMLGQRTAETLQCTTAATVPQATMHLVPAALPYWTETATRSMGGKLWIRCSSLTSRFLDDLQT
jgi:hypothetical protein